MILKLSITVFITQLIFIGCRTWNVQAIAKANLPQVLLSGGIVHISWLASIAIGAVSMNEILTSMEWQYVPVVLCSLIGSLIGSYIGLKGKRSPKAKNLTVGFVKSQGFKYVDRYKEEGFYYDEYSNENTNLSVFFNYFNDGRETYEVALDGDGLKKVSQSDFKVLMKVLN